MLSNDEIGVVVNPPLCVEDPDAAAKEQKIKELEKAYDELEGIRQDMVNTGHVNTEIAATLESRYPGILTDRYPRGGYTSENLNIALEEVGFKQVFLIGGIIAAIIGLIIGVFKMISSIFTGSGGTSNTARAEKMEKNNEAIKKKVDKIKRKEEVLKDVEDQIGRGETLDKKDLEEFVAAINKLLETNFTVGMGFKTICENARYAAAVKTFSEIEDNENDIAISVYKSGNGSKMIAAYKHLKDKIDNIFNKIEQDIKYISPLIEAYAPGPVRANPIIKAFVPSHDIETIVGYLRGFCESRGMVYSDPHTTAMGSWHVHPQARRLQTVRITEYSIVVKWTDAIIDACESISLSERTDLAQNAKKLIDKLDTVQQDVSKKAQSPHAIDREHYTNVRVFIEALLTEAKELAMLIKTSELVCKNALDLFHTKCFEAIRHLENTDILIEHAEKKALSSDHNLKKALNDAIKRVDDK